MELESACFDADHCDSRTAIRRTLVHPRHETWVLDGVNGRIDAALFLRFVRHTLRIYSVATHPELRGQGWGNRLLRFAEDRAREGGFRRISLEADAASPDLLAWYERHGFRRDWFLPDYYETGRDAWRMRRSLA